MYGMCAMVKKMILWSGKTGKSSVLYCNEQKKTAVSAWAENGS